MRYFIGYLIQDEAATWHFNLVKNISEKFNTWKLHEKIPPHITIFPPFETEDIDEIKKLLRDWTTNKTPQGNFTLSGFDHFDDNVVFAKIDTDESIRASIEELKKEIKKFPGMPEDNHPIWHPHATLMNKLSPEEIRNIWNYVSDLEKPNFPLPFDNITIFRFDADRKWVVDESIVM